MSTLPEWVLVIQVLAQVLLLPTVAGIGVWVAHRQKQIADLQRQLAEVRLRIDLYDRRTNVLKQLREFFGEVIREGAVSEKALRIFLDGVPEVAFLFDRSVAGHLDLIWKDAVALRTASKILEGRIQGKERSEMAEKHAVLLTRMLDHSRSLHDVFLPFLQIDPRNSLKAGELEWSSRWADSLVVKSESKLDQ